MTLRTCLGCGGWVSPGPRCPRCQRAWDKRCREARPAHHAIYRTAEWRRLSAEVRASATRCVWCLRPTRRLVADHIVPIDQRPDLALEPSNVVAACIPCNTRRGRNAKLPDLAAPTTHVPEAASAAGACSLPSGRPDVRLVGRPEGSTPQPTLEDLNR
jgi:5-methylcytosine-specific restriction enzyme A